MKYLFWAVVLAMGVFVLGITACGASHFEQLEAVSKPYDPAVTEKRLPQPDDAAVELVVTDKVEIVTNYGTMVVGLYGNDAPITVRNFLQYVDEGFYENKIFHRVIPGFMIQGGGFTSKYEKSVTDAAIPLEIIPGLKHVLGTVSMARTGVPDSATSQFFVCVAPVDQLNGEYSAFGALIEGFDIATSISQLPTGDVEADMRTLSDVPVHPVIIKSVKRL